MGCNGCPSKCSSDTLSIDINEFKENPEKFKPSVYDESKLKKLSTRGQMEYAEKIRIFNRLCDEAGTLKNKIGKGE